LRGVRWKFLKATEEVNRNAVTHERGSFTFDRLREQGEELIHLAVITTPVLATECVDSQVLNAKLGSASDDASQRFGSCRMSV
jgi:hypothetical protein